MAVRELSLMEISNKQNELLPMFILIISFDWVCCLCMVKNHRWRGNYVFLVMKWGVHIS